MASRIVTLSMINDYPFSIARDYAQPRTTIQVKKIIDFYDQPRPILKQKIRSLKVLQGHSIIQLLTTIEQETSITLIFQYTHKKLDNEIWLIDLDTLEWYKQEMLNLVHKFTQNCIVHQIRFDNVGIGKNNELKYFLGVNFYIDKDANQRELFQKYRYSVEGLFEEGGRFRRAHRNKDSHKIQFLETMDTTKTHHSREKFIPVRPNSNSNQKSHIAMKKCSTLSPSPSEILEEEPHQLTGSVQFNSTNYNHTNQNEIKVMKIQDIGYRINKLKDYVKNLTGKTPKNKTGLASLTVKIDQNNINNRIFQENKLYISPTYTKLQKKIAEWRQSKFYRAYGQQQVLYQKDNKGYQFKSSQNISNNNQTQFKSLPTPHTPKSLLLNPKPISPQHKTLSSQIFRKQKTSDNQSQKRKSIDSFNDSKNRISSNFQQGSYQNQYVKLGQTDKYCEQFMYLLEDQPNSPSSEQLSQMNRIIAQINTSQDGQNEQNRQKQEFKQTTSTVEIKSRVKKAIRNSLKLINGIKYRQSNG